MTRVKQAISILNGGTIGAWIRTGVTIAGVLIGIGVYMTKVDGNAQDIAAAEAKIRENHRKIETVAEVKVSGKDFDELRKTVSRLGENDRETYKAIGEIKTSLANIEDLLRELRRRP